MNNEKTHILKLFDKLQNDSDFKRDAMNNAKGEYFERYIMNVLDNRNEYNIGFLPETEYKQRICEVEKISEKEFDEKWKVLKSQILNKKSIEFVDNPFPNVIDKYMYQPFSGQAFPDFIYFFKDKVVAIEIKYSTKSKAKNINSLRPMWNSNLPKANAIYIFGVKNKDVTFFLGSDVLNAKLRNYLVDFFDKDIKKGLYGELDKLILEEENPFGFYPYIRNAYEQLARKSTEFSNLENKIIKTNHIESYFGPGRKERENNVISLLLNL